MKKLKRLTRYQRLALCNRNRWLTSLEQTYAIASPTISKVRSECRQHGYKIESRRRKGSGYIEYRISDPRSTPLSFV